MIGDNLKDDTINVEIEETATSSGINVEISDINYIPGYKEEENERRQNEQQRIANEIIRQTNEINRQNYINGLDERVERGDFNGQDGYTPIKGTDYFTSEDINSLKNTFVDLDNQQTITAKKTFNILPESAVAPTTGNQLVNKSYVDTSIQPGIDIIDFSDTKANILIKLNSFYQKYLNNKANSFIATGNTGSKDFIYVLKNLDTSSFTLEGISVGTTTITNYGITSRACYNNTLTVYISNNTVADYTGLSVQIGNIETGDTLSVDNTEMYEPENDYNPATKKYVDISILSGSFSCHNITNKTSQEPNIMSDLNPGIYFIGGTGNYFYIKGASSNTRSKFISTSNMLLNVLFVSKNYTKAEDGDSVAYYLSSSSYNTGLTISSITKDTSSSEGLDVGTISPNQIKNNFYTSPILHTFNNGATFNNTIPTITPTTFTANNQIITKGYVDDLVSGLQNEITSSNKLASDLVDDTNNTNKFVTSSEKNTWNNKSDFSGDYDDLTNKPIIPIVPTNVSVFTNDAGYLTSHQDISGKEDKTNKTTTLNSSNTNTQYPSAKAVYDYVDSIVGNINTVLATLTTVGGGN